MVVHKMQVCVTSYQRLKTGALYMEIEDIGQTYEKGDHLKIKRKPLSIISIGGVTLNRFVKKVTKVKRLNDEKSTICLHLEYVTPNNK